MAKLTSDVTSMMANLPLPSNLQFSYPKDWGAEETGLFGALADGSTAGAIKTAGLDLLSNVTSNSAQAAGQAKTGKTVNKRNKAIFRDLPFRQVSFAWTLRPRSLEMSQNFAQAIEDLRIRSAPELQYDGSVWSVSEAIWTLEITTEASAPANIIFKSDSLVITELGVNYTPNGFWSQHKDGYPTQIELTIGFMEVELAYKQRLEARKMV